MIKSLNRFPTEGTVRNCAWLKQGIETIIAMGVISIMFIIFSFACKSADYNIVSLSCALSRDSRRTQPASFTSSRDTEYLENSCVPSEELSCEYKRTENAYPRYLDTIVTRFVKYFCFA